MIRVITMAVTMMVSLMFLVMMMVVKTTTMMMMMMIMVTLQCHQVPLLLITMIKQLL